MSYQARIGRPPLRLTRAYRRVREDEAQAVPGRQTQLGDDGHEIMAVRAQAVQPDDGGIGGALGFQGDGGGGFLQLHGRIQRKIAALYCLQPLPVTRTPCAA
jgi:hypothetical protein